MMCQHDKDLKPPELISQRPINNGRPSKTNKCNKSPSIYIKPYNSSLNTSLNPKLPVQKFSFLTLSALTLDWMERSEEKIREEKRNDNSILFESFKNEEKKRNWKNFKEWMAKEFSSQRGEQWSESQPKPNKLS